MLLRKWPSDPFFHHLGAFSGPVISGEDPQTTLLRESQSWSINLAGEDQSLSQIDKLVYAMLLQLKQEWTVVVG